MIVKTATGVEKNNPRYNSDTIHEYIKYIKNIATTTSEFRADII